MELILHRFELFGGHHIRLSARGRAVAFDRAILATGAAVAVTFYY